MRAPESLARSLMAARYEQRAVLFLDVLGFKSLIKDGREDLIEQALEITTAQCQSNITTSAFSDCMVVSMAFVRGVELSELIGFASSLVLQLLHVGILSRGGIAVGELRHEGGIVYGPALIEAYELESKVACYPRVVLARDAIAKALRIAGHIEGYDEEWIRGFLRTDEDGWDHVNILDHKALMPFHPMLPREQPYTLQSLFEPKAAAVRRALENNLPADDRSRSKHDWLKAYAAWHEQRYMGRS